jgi:hypothetical protein
MTVALHGGMILPVGEGMGATQAGCDVTSLARAAANIPIITVADPLAIMPGPFGVQVGNLQGSDLSVIRAAARLSIKTVGAPGGMMASGSAGWATGVGGTAGWIGAWQWGASCNILSDTRAAAGIAIFSNCGKTAFL